MCEFEKNKILNVIPEYYQTKKLLFLSMLYLCLLAKVVSLTYGRRYSRSEKLK